jgi:hypothetical protein
MRSTKSPNLELFSKKTSSICNVAEREIKGSGQFLFILHEKPMCEVCLMRIKDQRDDFNFAIVNFQFICSDIPAEPAYGVYISQLIRYSRACGSYQAFIDRGLLLTRKLPNQGFLLLKIE